MTTPPPPAAPDPVLAPTFALVREANEKGLDTLACWHAWLDREPARKQAEHAALTAERERARTEGRER